MLGTRDEQASARQISGLTPSPDYGSGEAGHSLKRKDRQDMDEQEGRKGVAQEVIWGSDDP